MRDLILEKMYDWSKKPYQRYFKKNKAWEITSKELIRYPQQTLGFEIGCFLLTYNFELEPKLEDHDVIHVLTQTGVTVPEEIGMQFYLLGNGKRSVYQFFVITIGSILYVNKLNYFFNQFKRGKTAYCFYHLNFSKMLNIPTQTIRETFKIN
ncbi:hypothetical protein [Flavobacterium sp. XGLA_31]|uniref:hypothetical protein n=1 Tax=Flavobacterium sp. XGLA_31 TaxID=3447666 RepID=UPI003F300535